MANTPIVPATNATAKPNGTPVSIRAETITAPINDTSVLATEPATAV